MNLRSSFRSHLNLYLIVVGVLDIILSIYPSFTPVLLFVGVLTLLSGILISIIPRYPIRPLYLSCIIANIGIYAYAIYVSILLFNLMITIMYSIVNMIILLFSLLFLIYNLI